VHRMAIQNQNHRAWGVVQQPTAEIDEYRTVQVAVVGGKAQLAFGGDGRDQVDPEPIAGWSPPPGVRPTGAQVVPAWSSERTPASSAK
jgi:hypothetical protein